MSTEQCLVHIKAFDAKDLLKAEPGFSPDPYLKFRIKGKKKMTVKTLLISNTLNPVWNQELDIVSYDRQNDILLVDLYYEDIKNDVKMMDQIQIPLRDHSLGEHYVFSDSIKLGKKNAGHLHFELDFKDPSPTNQPAAQKYILDVYAVNAQNLQTQSMLDSYMSFKLKGNSDSLVKTQTISNNKNPYWDQHLMIEVPDVSKDVLLVDLWDEDIRKDDRLMNTIEIPLSKVPVNSPQVFNDDIYFKNKFSGKLHYEYTLISVPGQSEPENTNQSQQTATNTDYEKTIQELKAKNEKLEKELIEKTQELKNKNEKLEKELAEKTQELKNKNEKLEKELAEKTQELKNKNEKLEKELAEKTQELKNKNEKLEKELAEKTQELKDTIAKLDKLPKESGSQGSAMIVSRNDPIKILDAETITNLEKVSEIGAGRGGRVLKVAKKHFYALKIMNIDNDSDEKYNQLRHFLREYELMNMLNHPNILKTYGIFLSDENNPPSILLEFCPMNLSNAMKKNKLNKVQLVCVIYQIVEGMKYVHFQKIVHRDLKPSNILIAEDGTVKIGDFGIAKLMTMEQQLTTGGIGTQKFMAPEIINEEDYNEKADVYSFGVLTFTILNKGTLPSIKIRDICNGKKAEIPENFTEYAKNLINKCWSFEPSNRPSFEEILEDLADNKYGLVDLNKSEIVEVETFVSNHKALIGNYSS